jgi:hypothetical protein
LIATKALGVAYCSATHRLGRIFPTGIDGVDGVSDLMPNNTTVPNQANGLVSDQLDMRVVVAWEFVSGLGTTNYGQISTEVCQPRILSRSGRVSLVPCGRVFAPSSQHLRSLRSRYSTSFCSQARLLAIVCLYLRPSCD